MPEGQPPLQEYPQPYQQPYYDKPAIPSAVTPEEIQIANEVQNNYNFQHE